MPSFTLTTLATLVALVGALPSNVQYVSHEKRDMVPSNYAKGARIESHAILPVRIGLSQTGLEKGYDLLMEVSDPQSAKYAQYWTQDEIHDMFAPSSEAVEQVRAWLVSSGIHEGRIVHSDNRGWLAFDATTEEAESLFKTEFYEHEHRGSSKMRVGCDEYHVPEHIQHHIDYVTPGIKMTQVMKRSVQNPAKRSSEAKQATSKKGAKGVAPEDWPFGNVNPPAWQLPGHLPEDLRGCGYNITPACIRALYDIPRAHSAVPGNSLGLYEQGDYFAESDINSFYAQYAPYVPQNTFPKPALVDGALYSVPASNTTLNGGEADIDIDMAYSLIYPQSVTLYQVDDLHYATLDLATTNLFNTFLDALDGSYCSYTAYGETGNDPEIDPIYPDPTPGGYKGKLQCGVYKPTNVISASYGQAEADLPMKYSERQCNEFMKLGMQGHSILFASGDYGVASEPGDYSASGCLGPDQLVFTPQYPSNCPFVTSVGATLLYPNQTPYTPESVMKVNLGGKAVNFSSAGGFANYYAAPAYQKPALDRYFSEHNPPYPYYSGINVDVNTTTGRYNRIGRGIPDVSANGANFRAYTGGQDFHWYGASLAAPLFASVVTLINEERALIGKGPIGFLNPTLYSFPEVLNDIKNGTNLGCGTQGFSAVSGWDPATGLGTPNYPKMLALFLALP